MGYWGYASFLDHQSIEYPMAARCVVFDDVDSFRDLHLILLKTEEVPPQPKLNLIDIPGANGSKDMSDQPAGRVVYGDREFTWTFGLYPNDRWEQRYRLVSNALNGKYCEKIKIPARGGYRDDYYFVGRLSVTKYKRDGLRREITVKAVCRPYAYRLYETNRTYDLTTESRSIVHYLDDGMPVIPKLTTTAEETTIVFNGKTFVVSAGAYQFPDIEFTEGENTLEAKVTSGTGTLNVNYRGGSL